MSFYFHLLHANFTENLNMEKLNSCVGCKVTKTQEKKLKEIIDLLGTDKSKFLRSLIYDLDINIIKTQLKQN